MAEGYEAGRPFVDHYRPALLEPRLYYPDGQQREEVYDWGSFLSSRMHQRGVTCSDCHEPHGAGLRAPANALCLQCHAPARYDTKSHHLYSANSPGAACATCHMPTATYMVIDPRHDHSLRVPRPDLSVTLGVSNPCTACHRDRSASWAAGVLAVRGRRPEGFQRFAEVFAAADAGRADTTAALATLAADAEQPPIVRASALLRLAGRAGPTALAAARRGLGDGDPLVRYAALRAFAALPPDARAPGSAALHHALGLSMVRSGRTPEGVAELGRAAAADPGDARLAYVYAIGLDSLGKKDAALRTLEEALARRPDDHDILAALATLNRDAGRHEAARRYARRLVALDPQDAQAATLLRSLE